MRSRKQYYRKRLILFTVTLLSTFGFKIIEQTKYVYDKIDN